jgi:hypothetical protein
MRCLLATIFTSYFSVSSIEIDRPERDRWKPQGFVGYTARIASSISSWGWMRSGDLYLKNAKALRFRQFM